jgi:hypothetical protein
LLTATGGRRGLLDTVTGCSPSDRRVTSGRTSARPSAVEPSHRGRSSGSRRSGHAATGWWRWLPSARRSPARARAEPTSRFANRDAVTDRRETGRTHAATPAARSRRRRQGNPCAWLARWSGTSSLRRGTGSTSALSVEGAAVLRRSQPQERRPQVASGSEQARPRTARVVVLGARHVHTIGGMFALVGDVAGDRASVAIALLERPEPLPLVVEPGTHVPTLDLGAGVADEVTTARARRRQRWSSARSRPRAVVSPKRRCRHRTSP